MTSISLNRSTSQKDAANMTSLQRIDPSTHKICSSAGHVAIYVFAEETQSWERKGIEGSLFVVERCVLPPSNARN